MATVDSEGGVLLDGVPQPTVVVEPKSWWESKTMWWNVVTTGLEMADWAAGSGLIPLPFGPIIVGLGNIIIRHYTTQPVGSSASVPVSGVALRNAQEQYFAQMKRRVVRNS